MRDPKPTGIIFDLRELLDLVLADACDQKMLVPVSASMSKLLPSGVCGRNVCDLPGAVERACVKPLDHLLRIETKKMTASGVPSVPRSDAKCAGYHGEDEFCFRL